MPPALLYEAPACFGGSNKRDVHFVCLVLVFLNTLRIDHRIVVCTESSLTII